MCCCRNVMQAMVENMVKEYPNVLILRVRMPIVADMTYPRNFITKILTYRKVVNIPNSMTVLPELLPMAVEMAKRGLTGRWCGVKRTSNALDGCRQLYCGV